MLYIALSFFLLIPSTTFPMCNPCYWMYTFVAIPWDKLTDASLKQSELLYKAIQQNNFDQFKALLSNGATFKYIDPETGNTIMHELVKPKNIEYLKYAHQQNLLFSSKKNAPSFWPNERGYANLEIKNKHGYTLLHDACTYGNIEAINLLIDYQLPLHQPNDTDDIPLFLSIEPNKSTEFLDLFKKNSTEEEWKKACTEYTNMNGHNLIHIICKSGSAEQAKYILDQFPNVLNQKNIDNQTPLHFAVLYENPNVLNLLLSYKNLDVTAKDSTDGTVAMYALYRNDIDIFKKIITYDKKAINIGNRNGETPLHYLIKFKENESELAELVNLLIKDGANLSIKDKDGNTPLHYAVMQQNKKLVDLIIKKNPAVEKITNNNNETPFQIACNQQWKGGKEYFLTHLPKENQYITDLFKTEKIDYVLCEKILQQNSDNAYTKDAQGNTPLLIATERNDLKGIKLLLQYAPGTANIVNAKKDTPLHMLLKKLQKSINTETQKEIINLLLSNTNLTDPATNNLVRNEDGDSLLDLALYNTKLTIEMLNQLPDKAKAINEPHPKTSFSPFLTACKNGNIELVTLFAKGDNADLEQKVINPNSSFNGYTPLLLAANRGHKNVYDFLIEQGCNQKAVTCNNFNLAVLVTANFNTLDPQGYELKRIIKTYPEMITQKIKHDSNLLHIAIANNNKNAYTLLAQEYPSMVHEQNNNGNTPVHYAIHEKNTHALIIMKPTQNMSQHTCDTANYLFNALKTKDLTIIELFATPELINKRHTKNGYTALQYAVQHTPYKKYIELLIKRGANPKIKSSDNKDTLEMCLAYPDHDIFDLVLQSYSPLELMPSIQKTVLLKDSYFFGALLEKIGSVEKTTFFRQPIENKSCFLEYAIDNKLTDKITVALKKGLNPNEHFASGTLPLHYAIKKGNNEICTLLLEQKASLSDTDENGYNALMLSIIHHQESITLYLLKQPLNLNHKTKDGESLLHIGAKHANRNTFEKIIQKYPKVNEQDVHGNTPLHMAVEQGNTENVTLLLKHNANVYIQNQAGYDILTTIKNAKDRTSYFDQYRYDNMYTLVHEKIVHVEKAKKEVNDLYNNIILLQQQNNALVRDIKSCDPTLWHTTIYTPTSFVYAAPIQTETLSSDDLRRRKEALEKQKTKEELYKKTLQDFWQQRCQPYYQAQQPSSNLPTPSAPAMTPEELQAYQDALNKEQSKNWQHPQQQYWDKQNQQH